MKPEYAEGAEVREEFERTMTTLFRAPKPKERKQPEKAATERKSEKAQPATLRGSHSAPR
jgi:hypothetical protein